MCRRYKLSCPRCDGVDVQNFFCAELAGRRRDYVGEGTGDGTADTTDGGDLTGVVDAEGGVVDADMMNSVMDGFGAGVMAESPLGVDDTGNEPATLVEPADKKEQAKGEATDSRAHTRFVFTVGTRPVGYVPVPELASIEWTNDVLTGRYPVAIEPRGNEENASKLANNKPVDDGVAADSGTVDGPAVVEPANKESVTIEQADIEPANNKPTHIDCPAFDATAHPMATTIFCQPPMVQACTRHCCSKCDFKFWFAVDEEDEGGMEEGADDRKKVRRMMQEAVAIQTVQKSSLDRKRDRIEPA